MGARRMRDGYQVFADERGTLLPVELDEVPFAVRRLFVVHGSASGHPRGDHVVPCEQLAVLLSGRAHFRVTSSDGQCRAADLDRRGDRFALHPGEHVVYCLDDEASAVLVLASAPYADEPYAEEPAG